MKHGILWSTLALLTGILVADISGEEKGKPRTKSVTGVATKVEASSLTITQRGDSGDRTSTFAIGAGTKILLQTNEDETVKGGEGGERKVPRTKEGKIGDVKVEQRVTVSFTEAGKADSVVVLRPTPPRKKEGER